MMDTMDTAVIDIERAEHMSPDDQRGRLLKLARTYRGLTQQQTARAVGMPYWRYVRLEQGLLQRVTAEEVDAIVELLDVPSLAEVVR